MSRRRLIHRARTSVLTFVFVSALAYLLIPWPWVWRVGSNAQEDAWQQALRDMKGVGDEEALKDELLNTWQENEEAERSSSLRDPSDIDVEFEEQVGRLPVSLLVGLVVGALTWLPIAPKQLAPHHRHSHRRRSHSRRRSMIH